MTSDDYKSVDTVKQALGSIARLGRAYCVGSVYKQFFEYIQKLTY